MIILYISELNTLIIASFKTLFKVASKYNIINIIPSFKTIYRIYSIYFTFILNRFIISYSISHL